MGARYCCSRAVRSGAGLNGIGAEAGGFLKRQREQGVTAAHAGQDFRSLFIATPCENGTTAKNDRGQQRVRRKASTTFFEQHAEFGITHLSAAVFFRDHDARPAEFGHFLPERAGETIRVGVVAQFGHRNLADGGHKALDRGADGVIFDLEDAVRSDKKSFARQAVGDWLANNSSPAPAVWVRVNAGTDLRDADLEVVVHEGLTGLYVPKVSAPEDVANVAMRLDGLERAAGIPAGTIRIAALLETADGILDARSIARSPRMSHLSIGEADLAAELGMHPSPDGREMDPMRTAIVLASASARLNAPIGPVLTAFNDLAMLEATSLELFRLGYGGRTAVHPSQIPVINAAFSPTERDVERAEAIISRFDQAASDGNAVTVDADGALIDEAIVRRARRTIATHERSIHEN